MSLHTERLGSGPELVLLHGWGLHAGVWATVVERLAQDYALTLIDLPGHGRSRDARITDAQQVVQQLLEVAPANAVWAGWSLGGMLALRLAATAPARVKGLIMVAALPSFVEREDWPFGMRREIFAAFADDLENSFDATLSRFLSLQMRGVTHGRELLRRLREELGRYGEPEPSALRAGLSLLAGEDLRGPLHRLPLPVQMIMGERDTLVGWQGARQLQQHSAMAVEVIAGAGHAPFLSHPDAFCQAVNRFTQGLGS
ncbi:MAG: pimeloyl-ACP methyl ester esterase BioH [Granulosicoccaceae bacterium]|jgi:pimeloyl-[acyl-carrier protein] methyl ester esterase